MKKTTLLPLLATLLLAALPRPARSLEVSLEENRGERGSIGYVDLHRVFQRFPETHKARQNFQEIVRQAEEQVNLRKAELVALRADLSRLILERELLQKTPLTVPAAPEPSKPPQAAAPTPVPEVKPAEPPKPAEPAAPPPASESKPAEPPKPAEPAAAQPPLPDLKLPARQEMTLPGMNKPLTINLPGLTTGPVQIEPPVQEAAKSAEAPTPAEPPKPAEAPKPADAPKPAEPAAAPAPVLPPAPPQPTSAELEAAAQRSRQDRLAALDAQAEAKRKEIAAKEEEALKHQEQVEKNLLELESRRSEILLGKIYTVVQEVARENGVSVVVDKGQILFGQKTVDLTEKVLKKLESL